MANSPYGFAGQWTDQNGLVHMGARYYNPPTGTFISPDPLEGDPRNPMSLNAYAYAHGNPVNMVDPSGLSPINPGFPSNIPMSPNRPPNMSSIGHNYSYDPMAPYHWVNAVNSGCAPASSIAAYQPCASATDPTVMNHISNLQNYGVTVDDICDWEANPLWENVNPVNRVQTAISEVDGAVQTVSNRINQLTVDMYGLPIRDESGMFKHLVGSLNIVVRQPTGETFLLQANSDGSVWVSNEGLDRAGATADNPLYRLMVHEIAHAIDFRATEREELDPSSTSYLGEEWRYLPRTNLSNRTLGFQYEMRNPANRNLNVEIFADALANWFLDSFWTESNWIDSSGLTLEDYVTIGSARRDELDLFMRNIINMSLRL